MNIKRIITYAFIQRLLKLCYIDGLAQDSINTIANALELLQSCAKPSIFAIKW